MGNREALIEGAKTCLLEKGYTRTTARDIATAARVSLAAIGYHFGSKDALLNEAMRQALDEWGAEVAAALAGPGAAGAPTASSAGPRRTVVGSGSEAHRADAGARERFVGTWELALGTLATPSSKALWMTQFEVLSQGAHLPELLKELSELQGEAREGVATLFGAVDADADPATVQLVGSFLQALLLGVVALNLFDADKAPSGEDLAKAINLVANRISGTTNRSE